MPTQVLEARRLLMKYGDRVAVQDLSFRLHAGEILGFLGPNGAGKTTAIRMLTTILEPTDGSFSVGDINDDEPAKIRRRIGVLPESHGFPSHLTALEYLTYQARFFDVPRREAAEKATNLLDEVGLGSRKRSLISSFSRGMRQRLGIARALVNDPAVVFLDEPTLGLDPRGQEELMDLIRWMAREKGAGVIVCSHLLDEIEQNCDSIIILREGRVIANGPVADVVGRSRQAIRVRVAPEHLEGAVKILRPKLPQAEIQRGPRDDGWIHVRAEANDNAADSNTAILQALLAARIPVLGFESGTGRLHEAFLQLTEASA
ncbi:MAG: ABC transporter ATP-binding protein [Candidatus Thermoplasmatota archaeon]